MSDFQLSRSTPRSAFVPSPVFVGIVALFVVSGWMTWTGFGNVRVDVFLMIISGWLVSLCLHEYAHAVVAYLSGDRGVAERGYLRLNPLKYTHPLLSIVLPVIVVILGGIGLPGGAVWVDHRHIGSKLRQSLISAAGPLTNVVFALLLAAPFLIGGVDEYDRAHIEFWSALAALAFLQVTASVLNFLPVPGLDGGNMLQPWMSPAYQRAYDLFAPYGFMLLFVLLWQSELNRWFFTFVYWVTEAIGVPSVLSAVGLELMRFWSSGG